MRRGFGISKPAQSFNHVCLGVGLAAVDDVVDGLRTSEIRMVRLTHFGRDPAHVIVVGKKGRVAEVSTQQAKLPQVIGDVLPHIGHGSVGTDDHLGIVIDTVFCGRRSSRGAPHDPAALVLALGLQIEDTPGFQLGKGEIPKLEMEDLAFAGQKIIFNAQP